MSNPGPLEIIDRFAKAVEQHPDALPLTKSERETIHRVAVFYARLDAMAWFFGWGKWAVALLILIATQWDRIARAWGAWIGS